MAKAKQPQTITAICTACEWHGQRSLEKGEDLAAQVCPRCEEKKLAELPTEE